LTDNQCKRPELGPHFGPTLCELGCGANQQLINHPTAHEWDVELAEATKSASLFTFGAKMQVVTSLALGARAPNAESLATQSRPSK
jgi:hypothetical protein